MLHTDWCRLGMFCREVPERARKDRKSQRRRYIGAKRACGISCLHCEALDHDSFAEAVVMLS